MMKIVRAVSLVCDMPAGPPLHSYQISSKYVSRYESYGGLKNLFMDFCFRADNYIMKKVRVVSLACQMPIGPPLHPFQILSNYLKK